MVVLVQVRVLEASARALTSTSTLREARQQADLILLRVVMA